MEERDFHSSKMEGKKDEKGMAAKQNNSRIKKEVVTWAYWEERSK